MDYHKIPHPLNFRYATGSGDGSGCLSHERGTFATATTDHGDGVFHLHITANRWDDNASQAELWPPIGAAASGHRVSWSASGGLAVVDADGAPLLAAHPEGTFGSDGRAWILRFAYDPTMRFYGFGEKAGRLEKTGLRTWFWNTDVWADFSWSDIERGRTDPLYASVPWVVVRTAHGWVGILVDNPYPVFASAGGRVGSIANQQDVETDRDLYVGARNGVPSLWFVVGSSLAEVTARFQRLVGPTPLPPLWSLGHHQCRWGYGSAADLADLAAGFDRYGIPNSGLWLDIDFMDGYRVFTWNHELWQDPANEIATLQADGRVVVPILDPGVKREDDFPVAASGRAANAFCRTADGAEFVGFVWPGATLFPDFSTDTGRNWWRDQVAGFAAASGIRAAWLDMNDPSVGPVALDGMRFDNGQHEHERFHNQYAAGMARATRAGFLHQDDDRRPFLLTRSAFLGTQRYAAVWTGDNVSNDDHLAGAPACTLNLALSGIPFNGPDVPGFGQDASERLALRWYQAGFLFPFLRNHSSKGTRAQEPYTFSRETRETIAHLVRLRYRLLPYIYHLWQVHEATGTAILRPLIHDFDDTAYERVDDAFLVGPSLLQAPLVGSDHDWRGVPLPAGWWYDLRAGAWIAGGEMVDVHPHRDHVPLYARGGSLVAMQPAEPRDHHVDLATFDCHVFAHPGSSAVADYGADDGQTFAYRRGERSHVHLEVRCDSDALHLAVSAYRPGWKPLAIRLVAYDGQRRAVLPDGRTVAMEPFSWRATGDILECTRSPLIELARV